MRAELEAIVSELKRLKAEGKENIFIGVTFVTITAAVICFPSICVWALFGSGLRKFVTNLRIKKTIEYLLAILLVLTGLFILLK